MNYEELYKDCVWVDFETLTSFMVEVFKKVGVPEEDARICADVLITSDKRGIDSHGIGRFKPIYIDRINEGIINPRTTFEVVRESPTTALVDGHNGMGQVIAYRSMKMAIEKAQKYGMGMVVARNSNHYGIAGYYVLMACEKGMIGITGTNARPSIAPTFGVENMLGTNPLTLGFPTDEEFPFCLDCATSVTQRGKIEVYARLGKEMPKGWVIDENGESKTDPEVVLEDLIKGKAALTPLGGIGEEGGGYKGYGYATFVEVLSSALAQGAYLKGLLGFDEKGKKVPYRLGHFFIAINIENFVALEDFKRQAGDIMRKLRASRKMPGEERIWTAGEKEYDAWLYRKDKGVPIDPVLQKQIKELCERYNLKGFSFPF
jgi:LDH2 family malate/lactate/ureidoglycolate dehydrogenase